MDDRDRRILEELKADAWVSYAALAERVHLSASAVQCRVEKLIAGGVLQGAHARVASVCDYAHFVDENLNSGSYVRRFRTLTSIRQLI